MKPSLRRQHRRKNRKCLWGIRPTGTWRSTTPGRGQGDGGPWNQQVLVRLEKRPGSHVAAGRGARRSSAGATTREISGRQSVWCHLGFCKVFGPHREWSGRLDVWRRGVTCPEEIKWLLGWEQTGIEANKQLLFLDCKTHWTSLSQIISLSLKLWMWNMTRHLLPSLEEVFNTLGFQPEEQRYKNKDSDWQKCAKPEHKCTFQCLLDLRCWMLSRFGEEVWHKLNYHPSDNVLVLL